MKSLNRSTLSEISFKIEFFKNFAKFLSRACIFNGQVSHAGSLGAYLGPSPSSTMIFPPKKNNTSSIIDVWHGTRQVFHWEFCKSFRWQLLFWTAKYDFYNKNTIEMLASIFVGRFLIWRSVDNKNKYNQKLPHIHVTTKWMTNNYFFVIKSIYSALTGF